jgi:hypothetical protein
LCHFDEQKRVVQYKRPLPDFGLALLPLFLQF